MSTKYKIEGNHDFVASGGCLKGVKFSINLLVDGLSLGDDIDDKRMRFQDDTFQLNDD